ncbi:MAG: aspartate--tRNA ligase [Gammaproteobacteria bacterium]
MRSHYCGDIEENLIGKEVRLCGWVHRVRDLGGIIFFDLRDRAGLVQVVIDPENKPLAEIGRNLHNEYVLDITGIVRARPEGIVNLEMKTGKVEVLASKIDIINRAEALPFQINEKQNVSDEMRLRYRYLDLRRPEIMQNFILRAKIVQEIHRFLSGQGFIEVETPILTKSTPEGARDYLVPSRVHKGQFYALPQSPQIFKQLLMVAGFDRYYQIARCFRDEDLRADRQPEFTQLDVEMSFATARDIQDVHENLMRHIFRELLQVELPNPFPRLTYAEAMSRYGSDKPDLRFGCEFIEVKDLFKDNALVAFAEAAASTEKRIVALCVPGGSTLSRKNIDAYVELVGKQGLKGLGFLKVNDKAIGLAGLQSSLLKFMTEDLAQKILERTKAQNGDLLFFAAGDSNIVNVAMGVLRLKIAEDLNLIDATKWSPLWVVDFPLFGEVEGGFTSMHHPFTAPIDEDPERLEQAPGEALAQAYDLVLNGTELGGGSIRICNEKLQSAVFKILGMSTETAYAQFGHLLNAFKYGYPRHGGIAFGLDRIAMLMVGADSLRDVIAFPKTQSAQCPLTDAPSLVSAEQCKELGISVIPQDKK